MSDDTGRKSGLSVVIPVTERVNGFTDTLGSYLETLDGLDRDIEVIVVLDGGYSNLLSAAQAVVGDRGNVELLSLSRTFGESAVLTMAFDRCQYPTIMTLPAYEQVDVSSLPEFLTHEDDADLVLGRRLDRADRGFNERSGKLFHALIKRLTGVGFSDLGCGVRIVQRSVIDEIDLYGDQHRFLPILADRRGFSVVEVDLPQAETDKRARIYKPGVYVSRILDLLSVFFVVRFTKKPLRFFGMVGTTLGVSGGLILAFVGAQRLFADVALAERPIILLGSLLLVLGVQLFALGLVGELIIFTHARDLKEYTVAETVNMNHEQHGVDDA